LREAETLGRHTELVEGLQHSLTVCRGPKPVAVLKRQGLPVTVQAHAPYTTTELLEAMADVELQGRGVALVHYGERNEVLAAALQARGAQLDELCLYAWHLPDDLGPLQQLVRALVAGHVDAVAFTSQVQVRHLWQVASGIGLDTDLTRVLTSRCIVAAVGPTCAAALEALGVTPQVMPTHPKMGPMVTALAAYLEQTTPAGRSHSA
jgi:uroporphyrinogen-III synthase